MDLEALLGILGGGVGVGLIAVYAEWRKVKRGDKKDVVGAWQEIADRETARQKEIEARQTQLEARVTLLEKIVLEKDVYINRLERSLIDAGLPLPEMRPTPTD